MLGGLHRERAVGGRADDALRNRVLRVGLERGGEAEGLVGVQAGGGDDIDDAEFAARQRAGLVEDDRGERRASSRPRRSRTRRPAPRAERRGDGDDERNGEPQRMRTRDHEHGHEALDRERRRSPQAPAR